MEKCASCHGPGQGGPFSLLTYQDVRKRIHQIVDVTERRVMPPWLPSSTGPRFANDPTLSASEVALLRRWMELECPPGGNWDPPQLPAADQWQLGTPDLVVNCQPAYELAAAGPDEYRTFVVPLPLDTTEYLRTFEFRPENARVIHHANIAVRSRSPQLGEPLLPANQAGGSFAGMATDGEGIANMFNGWAPGMRPSPGIPGASFELRPGTELVVQLHLTRSGKPERVAPQVGLYFTDAAPQRFPVLVRVGSYSIDLAAGAAGVLVGDEYTLPIDATVLGISPHAHYLASEIAAWAVHPSGRRQNLLHIPDWNGNWQAAYFYEHPIELARGTRIATRFVYDNSEENIRNPFQPPRRIFYGPASTDEMCDLWLLVMPQSVADAQLLEQDLALKELLRRIDGLQTVLASHPDRRRRAFANHILGRIFVANAAYEEGREYFQAAVNEDPEFVAAYYQLGILELMHGSTSRAIELLEHVAAHQPSHAATWKHLADAHQRQGDTSRSAYCRQQHQALHE